MADNHSDANRLLAIKTVLDPDVLLVNRLTATERISRLFSFELELMAPVEKAGTVKASALIGASGSIRMESPGGKKRFFHGVFSRFEEGSEDRKFRFYRAELSPWLWLLTLTSDCRVFQDKTVPEMITDVFREHGQLDFIDSTTRAYAKWDCCIQYRETAFNFVSRLMEHEGIFYFFQHEEDKHVLTFADRLAGPYDSGEAPVIRFDLEAGHNVGEQIMTSWSRRDLLTPGRFVTRDFHYGLPKKTLEFAEKTIAPLDKNDRFEVYDFPGEFAPPFNEKDRFREVEQEGERLARIRMEEEESAQVVLAGSSVFPLYETGFKFLLTGHRTLNGTYVPLAIQHSVEQAGSHFHDQAVPNPYACTMTCAKFGLPFRPPRVTLRPVMQGPQTAMVIGPEGSEIHTDEFGRIKVRFHWDRKGDGLGCWVRVAQIWAGVAWGSQFIPRVGHEVVVDFIEGDPDQPIVIGSVYNAANRFPFELTEHQTQSGIKTRSLPGGGTANFNLIRFEDKKGHEQLWIHAERSMLESVEASQTITVGGSRSITTGGEKDGVTHGDVKELVYKNHNLHVKGDDRIKIDGKVSETVTGDEIHSTTGGYYLSSSKSVYINAPEVFIQGGTKLTLMVGGSFVVLDAGGVTVVGPMVKLNPAGAAAPVAPSVPSSDPPDDP
jgi:type VI secretion system secreted protein VgrG